MNFSVHFELFSEPCNSATCSQMGCLCRVPEFLCTALPVCAEMSNQVSNVRTYSQVVLKRHQSQISTSLLCKTLKHTPLWFRKHPFPFPTAEVKVSWLSRRNHSERKSAHELSLDTDLRGGKVPNVRHINSFWCAVEELVTNFSASDVLV